jgi:hypothetical protein
MRWTEQEARILCGTELGSYRVRLAFTAGMEPDMWVESNTGSRRDQLPCPNSPARRQRAVYKYPVTPLPPFSKRLPFSCLPSFTLSHSGPFRTALLSQSVQSLPRVDDLTPMATICLQQEVDSFSFALPSEYDVQSSRTPPLERFSSNNAEISDFGDNDSDFPSIKKILADAKNR